jgi:hypothetical protein
LGTLTAANASNVLNFAKNQAYSNLAKNIATQNALILGRRAWAAMFISNGSGTSAASSFTRVMNGLITTGYFPRQAYIDKIRSFMMIGPINYPMGEVNRCSCGEDISGPLYALSCRVYAPDATRRHTAVNNLLVALIKSLLLAANVQKEKVVGKRVQQIGGGALKQIKVICDILVQNGSVQIIVDVLLVEPSAKTCCEVISRRNSPRSSEFVNIAASLGEKSKRSHYAKVSIINDIPGQLNMDNFVPFVIESSGRLGPKAVEFIALICGTDTYKKSRFIKDISLICARY